MVFASTAPPSSAAAATCRWDFLLGVDLGLIGVIVDVVVALECVERDRREKESVQAFKGTQIEDTSHKK